MSESNGNGTTLDSLREQTELARMRARLAKAKHVGQLYESTLGGPAIGLGWGDLLSPFAYRRDDFGQVWLPLAQGGLAGRKGGINRPFTWTDIDLDNQRSVARWLAAKNDLAVGALRTLRNYTVKRGYEWEARPAAGYTKDEGVKALAKQVQHVIDDHADRNNLRNRERSSCWRAVRDGETITRHFAQRGGTTLVRFVEPEQVRDPGDKGDNCAFGVETDPHDVETVLSYYVTYDGSDYEQVPASEVCHLKRNVDECVKRGLSDFFSCADAFDGVYKLLRNMRVGGAVAASLAWIEEFESATRAQMEAHQGGLKDLNRPAVEHPLTGRRVDYEHHEPGTVRRVQKGKKFLPPPLAVNTGNFVTIAQACLRSIGTRWSMPEYMISGDASNANYSSTLVSGSPFVNAVECEQDDFGLFFLRWRWIAIRNACEAGLIRREFGEVERLIDLHYTPPLVAVANEADQATIDHADMDRGVLSIQTRQARRKLDPEQEAHNLKAMPITRVPGKVTDIDAAGNPIKPAPGGTTAPVAESLSGPLREQYSLVLELLPRLDGDERRVAEDLLEAVKGAQKRKPGEVWQGPSKRWFTMNQAGRVVPAKAPGGAQAEKPAAEKGAAKAEAPSVEEAAKEVVNVYNGATGADVKVEDIDDALRAFAATNPSKGAIAALANDAGISLRPGTREEMFKRLRQAVQGRKGATIRALVANGTRADLAAAQKHSRDPSYSPDQTITLPAGAPRQTGGRKATAPKAEKPTVDSVHAHLSGLIDAGKPLDHAGALAMVKGILGLTKPQIKELAGRLEAKLPSKGLKADQAVALVDRVMSGKAEEKPKAPGDEALDKNVLGAVRDMIAGNPQARPKLPEIYKRLGDSGVSLGQFHDSLRRLADGGAIDLHPFTGPLGTLDDPRNAMYHGRQVAYYASAGRGDTGGAGGQEKPEAEKPAAAKPQPVSTRLEDQPWYGKKPNEVVSVKGKPAPWQGDAAAIVKDFKTKNPLNSIPLPALHDEMKKRNPSLSVAEFQAGIKDLADRGEITLVPFTRPAYEMEHPEHGLPANSEVNYYAAPGRRKKG